MPHTTGGRFAIFLLHEYERLGPGRSVAVGISFAVLGALLIANIVARAGFGISGPVLLVVPLVTALLIGVPIVVTLIVVVEQQKRMARRLADTSHDLEVVQEESRIRIQLLGVMSHELRTPLNAVIGFSELLQLQAQGPLDTRYLDYIRDIETSGRSLLTIVEGVLHLASLDRPDQLQASWHPLSGLIEESLAMVRGTGGIGGDIAITVPVDVATHVLVDAEAFRFVLVHLVRNTVRFSPPDRRIELRIAIGNAESPGLTLELLGEGDGGIFREINLQTIPFWQSDAYLSDEAPGPGVDLAIIRRLVTLHDGKLKVFATPAGSLAITISLSGKRISDGKPAGIDSGLTASPPEVSCA